MGDALEAHAYDRRTRAERYAHVLDAIDGFSAIATLDGLVNRLETTFADYGIEHFVITGLPNPHERFETVVVMKHWPKGWFETYAAEDFVRADPVIRMCRATTSPFEWSEAPFDPGREPRALDVMQRARDFGLKRGFSLPVHGLNGYEACFSVSGANPDFDSGAKRSLHLLAMYAFEYARRLAPAARYLTGGVALTAREKEVLTWAAIGKSHADIAEIMHVTERTVTAHTVNATHKLGAANKTQAVVRAMQANLIRI